MKPTRDKVRGGWWGTAYRGRDVRILGRIQRRMRDREARRQIREES